MEQEMMKAAVLTGPRQITMKDVPVPAMGPGLLTSTCGKRGKDGRPARKVRSSWATNSAAP